MSSNLVMDGKALLRKLGFCLKVSFEMHRNYKEENKYEHYMKTIVIVIKMEELFEQLLESGEVQSGKGLNQERGLQRPGDIRWGSHCKTLDNFVILFSSIVHVLGVIECEGDVNDRLQAEALLGKIKAFEFIFLFHLMLKVLIMSNELSKTFQTKEQDIINAMVFLHKGKVARNER
ncbi:uncharacterized protein [Nicotiana tomentosiformis]|uniref:uncharacterized protein n=1 Tax=Nicotiana tomentosiformis TaxID=4098 RepID=UPI00388C8DA3